MPNPLRVGLIGAGWVTQHHLRGWGTLSGRARVVAIADPAMAAARARAEAFGVPAVYADAESMLANEALDAVDIAAPREFHAGLVRLAAGRVWPCCAKSRWRPCWPRRRCWWPRSLPHA